MSKSETTTGNATAQARIVALEAALASERGASIAALAIERERVANLTAERDVLRASHERLRLELELLKRRIFFAKAERVDSAQLELEFATKLAELDRLAGHPIIEADARDAEGNSAAPPSQKKKPTGRRDFRNASIEEERIEFVDPLFEEQVTQGKAVRIGFEESCKLGWKRGGLRRIISARVKYRVLDAQGESTIETTPIARETFPRSLAAPSLLAHVIVEKYCDGLPLHRQENRFARDGVPIDRGTLCRWVEDAGATAGATVIEAMRQEALRTSFCIATDATGFLVQPVRSGQTARQACRRGHYFVQIADRDHVFFEYTAKETSAAVKAMFAGYTGYVQADAKSVYDALYREPEREDDSDDDAPLERPPQEVGCWAHARRKFWEAAIAKDVEGREGLARIGRVFALDESWRGNPSPEITRLRNAHMRPHLTAFFEWAEARYEVVRHQRGLLRSALGYAIRQKDALLRPLEDGRIPLDNNRSERELRRIAVGRKAWLFVGSDDHAVSAGHLFSLIASARLHDLDPEAYVRDVFRVLAAWPRDRYLELAPKYWLATRAKLDATELANDLGPLTVPPPTP